MDPLKSLVKKKRLFTSFLKYDLLNQAAAETNLYSEEQGRELMEIARDNPVAAAERLLELIRVFSTYEAFILTLERSIEIGHSQQRTVVDAQAHEQLVNELAGDKKQKRLMIKGIKVSNPFKQKEKKSKESDHEGKNKDQDDNPLMDRDLLDSTNSGCHIIPEETVSGKLHPKGVIKRIPVTIHGEQMRQVKAFPLVARKNAFTQKGEFQESKEFKKNSKDQLSRSKSDHTAGSLHQLHNPGIQQESRDRASSMNSPNYKWGSSKLHPSYILGKNQGSLTTTAAISMDTGLGSTPNLADIQDDMEDDTDGVVRGKEQQPEDINALFSMFSIESVILNQQQSLEERIARLQKGQDELKKSVTAEHSELKKQIEELKGIVTALQEFLLTRTPSNDHGRMDMHQDMETTATITSRSEESMETTSTSSEDNNDYIVHITNSDTPAHEVKLHQLCWIPFGIQKLTVGQKGGFFCLQPQGSKLDYEGEAIMMEVAKNSVNTAVCDRLIIRYGVIAYGSFSIPNGYQLGSMVVYVYFEKEHATKPVVLHLPHWVVRDGEKNLKWVIAPHKLEENEESYPFQLAEEEAFDNRYGAISIDGHCSLFGTVFEEEAYYKEGLRYYATGLETCLKEGACLRVMITYASQAWLQILEKYRGTTSDSTHVLFTFKDSTIKGTLSEKQGNGWSAWVNANGVVDREDVEYKSHGIRNAGEMKRAVIKTAAYPPYISCQTTYSKEVRRTGVPTKVVLQIEGVKDKDMPFLCTAYEYRSEIERRRPVGHSDSLGPLPTNQTQPGSDIKLKLHDLMPYIDDLKDSGLKIAAHLNQTTNWTSIVKTNPDPADRLVVLLDTWLNDTEVETCPHTWDHFISIMSELRKGKLADRMAKELSEIRHLQTSDADV